MEFTEQESLAMKNTIGFLMLYDWFTFDLFHLRQISRAKNPNRKLVTFELAEVMGNSFFYSYLRENAQWRE